MKELFNASEMFLAFKAAGLGLIIGGVFAFFKFTPPSPDNLAGIFGIIGIFTGWAVISYLIN
jgi:XapX domain-containing protein